MLYVGTQEPALKAISVPDGRIVNSIRLPAGTGLQPKPDDVNSIWDALSNTIEVSPDGKTLAVAEGNDVVLYDAATLNPTRRLRGHSDLLIQSLRFSPDGTMLATGSADHTARVWNVALGAEIYQLTGHTDAVLALAFFAGRRHPVHRRPGSPRAGLGSHRPSATSHPHRRSRGPWAPTSMARCLLPRWARPSFTPDPRRPARN